MDDLTNMNAMLYNFWAMQMYGSNFSNYSGDSFSQRQYNSNFSNQSLENYELASNQNKKSSGSRENANTIYSSVVTAELTSIETRPRSRCILSEIDRESLENAVAEAISIKKYTAPKHSSSINRYEAQMMKSVETILDDDKDCPQKNMAKSGFFPSTKSKTDSQNQLSNGKEGIDRIYESHIHDISKLEEIFGGEDNDFFFPKMKDGKEREQIVKSCLSSGKIMSEQDEFHGFKVVDHLQSDFTPKTIDKHPH